MRRLGDYASLALSGFTLLIILYACFEIFTRFFFKTQNLFCNDLVLAAIVSVILIFSIHAVNERVVTSIDIIPSRLSPRKQVIYQIALDMLGGITCLFLGLSGFILVRTVAGLQINISTVLPVPAYLPILALVIGMLGSSAAFFIKAISSWKNLKC